MNFQKGDMFKLASGVVLVTTNATLRKDGTLVMGRGAAKQAADLYPGLDLALGKRLNSGEEYNIILPPSQEFPIGAFQVKYHWREDADLALVYRSVLRLANLASRMWMVYWHVNYPGIGNGRLSKEQVAPLLADLPDNVYVWEAE